MATKSQSEGHVSASPESFASVKGKALQAVSAFAEANERVAGELIEFSSSAARESLRTYTEIQAAAVEAVRTAPALSLGPGEIIEELRRDPFAWLRGSLNVLVDGTHRAAKLVETNAQIMARNTERLQASAERTAKEIEQAANTYVGRMKEIYARN